MMKVAPLIDPMNNNLDQKQQKQKQKRLQNKKSSEDVIKPKGFKNVGNTCYANAALQCLLSSALSHVLLDTRNSGIFRRYSSNPRLLLAGSGSVDSDEDEEDRIERKKQQQREKQIIQKKNNETCEWLTHELTDITRQYTLRNGKAPTKAEVEPSSWGCWLFSQEETDDDSNVVDPSQITRHVSRLSPCLHPYQQEDAHEFLRALLSTLTLDGHNKNLSSLFDGLLESAVTCQTCRRASMTRDRYMDLSLDIASSRVTDLPSALSHFTKTEHLGEDNQVFCDKCQTKRVVTKGLRLATAPTILVCHFKRFSYDNYGRIIRLNKDVSYPLRLEIGPYMSRANRGTPPPYELVGVLVHTGRTCQSGHYLAYVKCSNDWYKANDSVVSKVDIETVLQQKAYILIYEVEGMRVKHGLENFAKYHKPDERPTIPPELEDESFSFGETDSEEGDIHNNQLDMLRHTHHNISPVILSPKNLEADKRMRMHSLPEVCKQQPLQHQHQQKEFSLPQEEQLDSSLHYQTQNQSTFSKLFQACGMSQTFDSFVDSFFDENSRCCPTHSKASKSFLEKGGDNHSTTDNSVLHLEEETKTTVSTPIILPSSDTILSKQEKKHTRSMSFTNLSEMEFEAAKAYRFVSPPSSRESTPVRSSTTKSTTQTLSKTTKSPPRRSRSLGRAASAERDNRSKTLSPTRIPHLKLTKKVRPRSRSRGAILRSQHQRQKSPMNNNKPPLSIRSKSNPRRATSG